eukprot:gene23626-30637_t
MPNRTIAAEKIVNELQMMIGETFTQLSGDLVKAHKQYREKERARVSVYGTVAPPESTLSLTLAVSHPDITQSYYHPNEEAVSGGLFGDPETRSFYEDLPDFLSLVPITVLGFSPEQEEWEQKKKSPSSTQPPAANSAAELDSDVITGSAAGDESVVADGDGEGDAEEGAADHKGARKKLIPYLIKLPRARLELAPTYARIELVKFGVAPPIVAFRMCKALMDDLTQHNVDLLAALLETCGRYLYLIPYTREKDEVRQSAEYSSVVPLSAAPVPLPVSATLKADPRVASEVDPFSDLLRAQIVCEILNTCGIYYVR